MAAVKKRSRRWWWAVLVVALLWLPGFAWFYQQVPREGDFIDTDVRTDAIVVLTGGMGRIEQGLKLLREGRSGLLLISGVDKDVRPQEVVAEYGLKVAESGAGARIVLDYGPRDTIGNARETARWMREQGFTSMRLVTSSYHIPRSMMEFRQAMPEAVILPVPAFPEWAALDKVVLVSRGSLRLILLEYHKYLFRRLYYALPAGLQVWAGRSSTLHPMADIELVLPSLPNAPQEEPAE